MNIGNLVTRVDNFQWCKRIDRANERGVSGSKRKGPNGRTDALIIEASKRRPRPRGGRTSVGKIVKPGTAARKALGTVRSVRKPSAPMVSQEDLSKAISALL